MVFYLKFKFRSRGVVVKIVFCFILILPLSCFSSDVIDREMVEEFLYKEKKFIQNKDVSGFSLLFADDFMGKDRNGKTIGKRDVVTDISSAFINASLSIFTILCKTYQNKDIANTHIKYRLVCQKNDFFSQYRLSVFMYIFYIVSSQPSEKFRFHLSALLPFQEIRTTYTAHTKGKRKWPKQLN